MRDLVLTELILKPLQRFIIFGFDGKKRIILVT